MKIHFYSDPGHGWGKVPRNMLHKYGVASAISPYSYERGDYVYLEEDCDLSLFVKAVEATGRKVELDYRSEGNRMSRIRDYDRYTVREMA